jgi:hypothetical protein
VDRFSCPEDGGNTFLSEAPALFTKKEDFINQKNVVF